MELLMVEMSAVELAAPTVEHLVAQMAGDWAAQKAATMVVRLVGLTAAR